LILKELIHGQNLLPNVLFGAGSQYSQVKTKIRGIHDFEF